MTAWWALRGAIGLYSYSRFVTTPSVAVTVTVLPVRGSEHTFRTSSVPARWHGLAVVVAGASTGLALGACPCVPVRCATTRWFRHCPTKFRQLHHPACREILRTQSFPGALALPTCCYCCKLSTVVVPHRGWHRVMHSSCSMYCTYFCARIEFRHQAQMAGSGWCCRRCCVVGRCGFKIVFFPWCAKTTAWEG